MKNLNNLLLIITLLVGFNSCVVTKKQRENFLAKHCERKDSISYVRKDSIVYKDSLIYIPKVAKVQELKEKVVYISEDSPSLEFISDVEEVIDFKNRVNSKIECCCSNGRLCIVVKT